MAKKLKIGNIGTTSGFDVKVVSIEQDNKQSKNRIIEVEVIAGELEKKRFWIRADDFADNN